MLHTRFFLHVAYIVASTNKSKYFLDTCNKIISQIKFYRRVGYEVFGLQLGSWKGYFFSWNVRINRSSFSRSDQTDPISIFSYVPEDSKSRSGASSTYYWKKKTPYLENRVAITLLQIVMQNGSGGPKNFFFYPP